MISVISILCVAAGCGELIPSDLPSMQQSVIDAAQEVRFQSVNAPKEPAAETISTLPRVPVESLDVLSSKVGNKDAVVSEPLVAVATLQTTVPSSTSDLSSMTTKELVASQSTTGRLFQQSDLQLVGRFRLPLGGAGLSSTTYSRGGMTIGDEGSNPTIYVAGSAGGTIAYGGDPDINVGEINVPLNLSSSADLKQIPFGTFKQPMTNVLEGRIRDVFNPSTPDTRKLEVEVRGLFKSGDRLLVNAIVAYDSANEFTAGHFSRPADLSLKGAVSGPVRVAPQVGVRHSPGPMFAVPASIQSKYGWPSIATGVNGLSINSTISNGPGLILYDPKGIETAEVRGVLPGLVLADYPYPNGTFAETMGFKFGMSGVSPLEQNTWWTPVNHTRGGGAWIEKFETVMFAGLRGLGAPFYGVGNAPKSWAVADPTNSNQAPHAYPYQHVLYLFDQKEYVAVQAGQKSPNQVKAYSVIGLDDPFGEATQSYQICGTALDNKASRLYVRKCNLPGTYGESLIEVYQLK
jgi:hypothetical protein